MKKLAVLCITALGSALLVLGTAPAASAYPDLSCNVTVDHQTVNPGDTFTATGEASGVDSDNQPVPSSQFNWTFHWNGVTKHRTGAVVQASFTAPEVKKTRTIKLTAQVKSPAGNCVRHIDITVVGAEVSPPGGGSTSSPGGGTSSPGGGLLPNTGGPQFWLLVFGLALVLLGGGAVGMARRRAS